MMDVSYVPKELIEDYLPSVSPLFQKTLDKSNLNEFRLKDIAEYLLRGEYQLFIAYDEEDIKCAVATEVAVYPLHSNLRVVLMGGKDITEWDDSLEKLINDFAAYHNLKNIEVYGRKGWVRYLNKYGYNEVCTMVMKPVEAQRHED